MTCFTKAGITFQMLHVTADCAIRYFLLVSFPRISSCLFHSLYSWYPSIFLCSIFWRTGGGADSRGRSLMFLMVSSPRPFNSPLENAGVFPAQWQQVTVFMCETNVGHMTAMALILITWSLIEKLENKLLMSSSISKHLICE